MKKQNYIYTIWLGLFSLVTICTGLVSCSEEDNQTSVAPEITLDKTNLVLEVGSSERLTASFNPPEAPNKGHTWTSSAANIASVDETGMVTAVAEGNAVITVQALDGGKMASCNVQVIGEIIHVTGVSLNVTNSTIAMGEQLQLAATVSPETATDKTVMWTSSNHNVATVDGNGLVTGVTEGTVVITATSNDGDKKATCQLTVDKKGASISAPEVSNITATTALVSGSIRALAVEIQEQGLCYATTPSPTVDEQQKVVLTGEDILYTLTGLTQSTTYYVRLYAVVDGNVSYGEEVSFTTTGEIITHFEPTDIYLNKIELASMAPSGITSIKICYGTSPNPKITDNIISASLKDDGLLHLTLESLNRGTTYYLRSYVEKGSSVEYNDDEVAVKTIGGKDFSVNFDYAFGVYGSYDVIDIGNFRVRWTVNYNIDISGTYVVTGGSFSEVGKNNVFSGDPIYVESGTGSFNYRKEGGSRRNKDGKMYVTFYWIEYITFLNMETNVKYHYDTPVEEYVLDL